MDGAHPHPCDATILRVMERCCTLRDLVSVCINIQNSTNNSVFLRHVHQFRNLQHLHLVLRETTAADIRHLQAVRSLTTISLELVLLRVDAAVAAALASLSVLPELASVKLKFLSVDMDAGTLWTILTLCYTTKQLLVFCLYATASCESSDELLETARRMGQRTDSSVRDLTFTVIDEYTTATAVEALVEAITVMPCLRKVDLSIIIDDLTASGVALLGRIGCMAQVQTLSVGLEWDTLTYRVTVSPAMIRGLLASCATNRMLHFLF